MKSAKQQQKQLQEASSRKYKEKTDLFNVWNADYAENATSVPNNFNCWRQQIYQEFFSLNIDLCHEFQENKKTNR